MTSHTKSKPDRVSLESMLVRYRPKLVGVVVVALVVFYTTFYLMHPNVREILRNVYFIPVGLSGFLFGWTRASGLALFGFCIAFMVGFSNFVSDPTSSELIAILVWGCALGATGGILGLLATNFNHRFVEEIEKQTTHALTDALTQISNRRAFDFELKRRLDEFQRRRDELSIIIIDVDHFKQFNDRYGHDVGDAILVSLASVIKDCLRNVDLVSRFGGEEFAAILPATGYTNARLVAERIRSTIEKRGIEVGGMRLQLKVSVGGAIARTEDTPAEIIRRADQSLYSAKQKGRNQVVFADESEAIIRTSATSNNAFSELHERTHASGDFCDPITHQTFLKVFSEEFRRRAVEANRYRLSLSFCLIDIANYGEILAQGDNCSKHILGYVAERIRHVIRDSDVMTWYSADQFAIMCPNTKANDARTAVKRILGLFAKGRAPVYQGRETPVRLEARVAELFPGESSYDLIERTEQSSAFRFQEVCQLIGGLDSTSGSQAERESNSLNRPSGV